MNKDFRIDVLTKLSRVDFDQAWETRVERPLSTRLVAYLGLEELIENKEATGRPKDLVDLEMLRQKI